MTAPWSHAARDEFADRDYPLREDMHLQRRLWRMQRVGWWLLGVFMLLSLLGVFSSGVLSKTRLQNASGDVAVEYERFERRGARSRLILQVQADGKETVLELDGNFLDSFDIESIHPQPETSVSHGNGIRWHFAPGVDGWTTVHVTLTPEGLGRARTTLSVPGKEPVRITQFIYP